MDKLIEITNEEAANILEEYLSKIKFARGSSKSFAPQFMVCLAFVKAINTLRSTKENDTSNEVKVFDRKKIQGSKK